MNTLYDDLITGLNQAIEIKKGNLNGRKTTLVIEPVIQYNEDDVKRIRTSSGMSQSAFAEYMGVSPKTVEAWEHGTNKLSGPVCRILSLMEKYMDNLPFVQKS